MSKEECKLNSVFLSEENIDGLISIAKHGPNEALQNSATAAFVHRLARHIVFQLFGENALNTTDPDDQDPQGGMALLTVRKVEGLGEQEGQEENGAAQAADHSKK